jgi:hypothetical protein
MRNVLLFPDGTSQDFMYPPNREVEVNEMISVTMLDDSVHNMEIKHIERTEKVIYYHLAYSG